MSQSDAVEHSHSQQDVVITQTVPVPTGIIV